MNAPAVELHGITKRFPGVVANQDVALTVRAGTIHAIVGENGAGKSTLMKILYGLITPDEGTIAIDGQTVDLGSPSDAIGLGVGMVHQHFKLADNLTVWENVVLGAEPTRNGMLDTEQARARIRAIGERHGLGVDTDALVENLGVGDRQRVEILKVLFRGVRTLILDEPTAVLVPQEVTELFSSLQEMKAEGISIVFISHKLDEVLAIADDITVLRRGRTVASVDPNEVTSRKLAELMVGTDLGHLEPQDREITGRAVAELVNLSVDGEDGRAAVRDVSLTVHAGEIVGIAGVEGNGQTELVEAVIGVREARAGGIVRLDGVDVSRLNTRKRREAGIAYIPEDRTRHGSLGSAPLWENRMLGHQTKAPNARGPLIDRAGARADTERIVHDFDVRTPSVDVNMSSLSGGNQQKLIVGREMSGKPPFLIASHPTRGVDIGAQNAIWTELRAARDEGLGVLLLSADLDELVGLSDRILVMYRGAIVAEMKSIDATPQSLGAAMTGANGEAA